MDGFAGFERGEICEKKSGPLYKVKSYSRNGVVSRWIEALKCDEKRWINVEFDMKTENALGDHRHSYEGSTDSELGNHQHGYSGTTQQALGDHHHYITDTDYTRETNLQHAHGYSGTTENVNLHHAHDYSGNTDNTNLNHTHDIKGIHKCRPIEPLESIYEVGDMVYFFMFDDGRGMILGKIIN